jgi:hypothetical protein
MKQGKHTKIFDKLKKCKFGIICAFKKNENIILNFFGVINIGCKEWTMKKLSVFLLAMVFIFGLAAQANAGETVDPQVVDDETVFAGDEPIMFEGAACASGGINNMEYNEESGVSFSPSLYGNSWLSYYYMYKLDEFGTWVNDDASASNFNECIFENLEAPAITVTFDTPVTRVGFYGRSLEGKIMVTVFRGGVASEPLPFGTEDDMKFIGIMDSEGIEAIEISGTGQFYGWVSAFLIDEFRFGGTPDTGPKEPPAKTVDIDIKPPNCLPAAINMKSKGVTPVVIAGSDDFDVTMIDLTTILLNGVAPERSAFEDVPYCSNGPDEVLDLTLKFDTQELVDAMKGSLTEGSRSEIILKLTGKLLDGTPIEGEDMVSVKGKPGHDRGHHKGWDNSRGHHKGWKNHPER